MLLRNRGVNFPGLWFQAGATQIHLIEKHDQSSSAGLLAYPDTKMDEDRMVALMQRYGLERIIDRAMVMTDSESASVILRDDHRPGLRVTSSAVLRRERRLPLVR